MSASIAASASILEPLQSIPPCQIGVAVPKFSLEPIESRGRCSIQLPLKLMSWFRPFTIRAVQKGSAEYTIAAFGVPKCSSPLHASIVER